MKKFRLTGLVLFLLLCSRLCGGEWDFIPDPVASIGPRQIHRAELLNYLTQRSEDGRLPAPENVKSSLFQWTVNYVDRLLLLTEAAKINILPTPARAEAALRRQRETMSELERRHMEQNLLRAGNTVEAFIKKQAADPFFQQTVAVDDYVARTFRAGVMVDFEDCVLYYEENLEQFSLPAEPESQLNAQVLLLTSKVLDAASLRESVTEIRTKLLNGLSLEQLMAGLKDYPQLTINLVTDYQFDRTKPEAEDPLNQWIASQPENTISAPYEYQKGCWLLCIPSGPRPQRLLSYAQAQSQIAKLLIAREIGKKMQAKLDELFKLYDVNIYAPRN